MNAADVENLVDGIRAWNRIHQKRNPPQDVTGRRLVFSIPLGYHVEVLWDEENGRMAEGEAERLDAIERDEK